MWLACQGWQVTALDISPRALARSKAMAAEAGLQVEGVAAALHEASLLDASYDLAAYLEYYRATVEMKCRSLTAQQTRVRPIPPSALHFTAWSDTSPASSVGGSSRTSSAGTCRSSSSAQTTLSSTSIRPGRRLRFRPGGLARGVCGLPRDRRSALAGASDDHRVRAALRARRSASRGCRREDWRMIRGSPTVIGD